MLQSEILLLEMLQSEQTGALLWNRRLSIFSWCVFEEEDVTLETPAFVRQEEDVLRRQAVHVDQERVEVRLGQIKRQICSCHTFLSNCQAKSPSVFQLYNRYACFKAFFNWM